MDQALAVRALAGAGKASAAALALRALDSPMDRVLDYALWLTLRELEPHWLPEFQSGKLTFGGDAKKLAFALNAVGLKSLLGGSDAQLESLNEVGDASRVS